ncbi:hypothetical protein Emed_005812 [Eimeria media]
MFTTLEDSRGGNEDESASDVCTNPQGLSQEASSPQGGSGQQQQQQQQQQVTTSEPPTIDYDFPRIEGALDRLAEMHAFPCYFNAESRPTPKLHANDLQ